MITFYKRFRIYFFFLIFGVSFGVFLSGCVNDEDTIEILPNVILSVTTLDFQANVGGFFIRTVTVSNPNNEDIIVERVTSTSEGFRVGGYFVNGELIDLTIPFTIERNGAVPLYVGFYPTEQKEYSGTLVIESRDANSGYETDLVDLRGIGLPELN